MNLPNKLTLSRLILTFLLLVFLFVEFPFHETTVLVLFIVASLTDYWDGVIARREKIITNFGILLDPLADKVLTCSLFIAFVGLDQMPAWMVIIIVARDLSITGLRLLAASKNIVLAAERLGKHKTTSQIVTLIAMLVFLSYPEWGPIAATVFEFPILGQPWLHGFVILAQWVSVCLTLVSGVAYLWRNREIYLDET